MADTADRLTVGLADRHTIERELGADAPRGKAALSASLAYHYQIRTG